jgi:uncharacterized protein
MRMFMVRSVPVAGWSSPNPLNFRPRLTTMIFLSIGVFFFGLGETLILSAGIGVSPWMVLAQGLGIHFGTSIGLTTFLVSFVVLLAWIPLRQCPGIGTIFNTVIIAATIEFVLPLLPVLDNPALQVLIVVAGILLVGFGSGIYLVANLGPGTRDGLMTGLQRVTQLPIAWVRISIEVTVVLSGWALGGTVGIGTVLYALGIGYAVSMGLYLTAWLAGTKDNAPAA